MGLLHPAHVPFVTVATPCFDMLVPSKPSMESKFCWLFCWVVEARIESSKSSSKTDVSYIGSSVTNDIVSLYVCFVLLILFLARLYSM